MTHTIYEVAADKSHGLRIKIYSEDGQERDYYGIRKSNEGFSAMRCGDVKPFKTLGGAIKYLRKAGYDAFGNAI